MSTNQIQTKTNSSEKGSHVLGLLREGFRQYQMIGICTLVILLISVVLLTISNYKYSGEDITTIELYQINVILLLAIPMTFLMTLALFRFLNHRAASDLYHALSHKRLTLYSCFAGAIILWILIWIAVSTLASMLLCGFTNQINLMYDTILPYTASILMMCLLVMTATLVVMSVTGTVFTNVLMTLILLFLPRFSMEFFNGILTNNLPFVLTTSSAGFFSSRSNLLFSLLTSMMNLSSEYSLEDVLLPGWRSVVYTLLLSLVYFAVGGLLFLRRQSEAAGQSAPSRLLQHIYRILIAMIPCLFISGYLAIEYKNGYAADDAFAFFVFYLIAVLIYFAYELITTRKWKNLLSALPGLGVVAVLNLAILFGMNAAYNHILENRPSPDEIESVSIYQEDDMWWYYSGYFSYAQYVDMTCQSISIADDEIIALVSEYLAENLDTWETDSEEYYSKYFEYVYTNTEAEAVGQTAYQSFCVNINTKSGTISRIIYFPSDEAKRLTTLLQNNETYRAAWYDLPDYIEGSLLLYNKELKQDDLEEIYDSYCAELQTCDFETLYAKIEDISAEYAVLEFTFRDGSQTGIMDCTISSTLTPDTMQLVYDKISATQADEAALLADAVTQENETAYYYSLDANSYLYDANGNRKNLEGYLDSTVSNEMALMEQFWQYVNLEEPLTVGGAKATIYFYDNTNQIDHSVTLPVDEALFQDKDICESALFTLYYVTEDDGYVQANTFD